MKNKKYEEASFTELVKKSNNLTDIAKNLDLKPFCGNRGTIKKYIKKYNIDISHFKIDYSKRKVRKRKLFDILVSGSTYNNTTNLKDRLYNEDLKERICEKCGQGENWNGEKMSLILDHKNGINDDNRINNLQIVCPNCNATLSTHGGRNRGNSKYVKVLNDSIESKSHIKLTDDEKLKLNISQRKVKRPSHEQLLDEIKELGYTGTGRKYGVSDNAIRKWVKFYEKY